MEIGKADWINSVDVFQKIHLKCPDNWESLTVIKCINGDGGNILPFLIMTAVHQLAL